MNFYEFDYGCRDDEELECVLPDELLESRPLTEEELREQVLKEIAEANQTSFRKEKNKKKATPRALTMT